MVLLAILCALLALTSLFLWLEQRRRSTSMSAQAEELRAAGTRLASSAASNRLKLNALSQSSGAGIVMFDERGSIVHSNDEAKTLLQDIDSAPLSEFAMSAFRAGAAGARDLAFHGRVIRAAAHYFEKGLSGVAEVMVVLSDVTERRRLENVRRDFVANVSHELRTPLASIRVIAETLQDGAITDPAVAQRFLETIVRETDRLERISSDLLVLSNAESGAPSREPFDLREVMADVVLRFEARAAAMGVKLTLEPGESLPLTASPDQMDQVLLNLVDNAIKFSPRGGSVSVRSGIEGHDAVVEVTDTGIGIKNTDLGFIFERFYRADKSRTRQPAGTGLGLSIVKDIVEAAGGTVSVTSQVGHGSTFSIRIPLGS